MPFESVVGIECEFMGFSVCNGLLRIKEGGKEEGKEGKKSQRRRGKGGKLIWSDFPPPRIPDLPPPKD